MAQGILLIQVEGPEDSARRTGRIAVVREEAIPRMLPEGPLRDSVLRRRAAFIPTEVWAALGLPDDDETQPQETGDRP